MKRGVNVVALHGARVGRLSPGVRRGCRLHSVHTTINTFDAKRHQLINSSGMGLVQKNISSQRNQSYSDIVTVSVLAGAMFVLAWHQNLVRSGTSRTAAHLTLYPNLPDELINEVDTMPTTPETRRGSQAALTSSPVCVFESTTPRHSAKLGSAGPNIRGSVFFRADRWGDRSSVGNTPSSPISQRRVTR